MIEALHHAGTHLGKHVEVELVDGEALSDDNVEQVLGDASGILVPGGFGKRAFDGKIIPPPATRASTRYRIWASAWVCRSPCASSRATCWAMRTRARPSSTRSARTP